MRFVDSEGTIWTVRQRESASWRTFATWSVYSPSVGWNMKIYFSERLAEKALVKKAKERGWRRDGLD